MQGLSPLTTTTTTTMSKERKGSKTIKVKIEFTVEVDVESWCLNFEVEPKDVRRDVKNHVHQGILQDLVHYQGHDRDFPGHA